MSRGNRKGDRLRRRTRPLTSSWKLWSEATERVRSPSARRMPDGQPLPHGRSHSQGQRVGVHADSVDGALYPVLKSSPPARRTFVSRAVSSQSSSKTTLTCWQQLVYVLMNPVDAGIVEEPRGQWKWSSYSATIGIGSGAAVPVAKLARHAISRRVEERVAIAVPQFHERSWNRTNRICSKPCQPSGRSSFARRFAPSLAKSFNGADLPRSYKSVFRPSLEELFAEVEKQERSPACDPESARDLRIQASRDRSRSMLASGKRQQVAMRGYEAKRRQRGRHYVRRK